MRPGSLSYAEKLIGVWLCSVVTCAILGIAPASRDLSRLKSRLAWSPLLPILTTRYYNSIYVRN